MKPGDEITGADSRTYTVIKRKGCRVLLGVESSQSTHFVVAYRPYPIRNNRYAWDSDVYFSGDVLRAARFMEQQAGGINGTRNRNFE